ncbi:hypothetical protein [Vibrio tetraodonis]|uniref:hypothetical protein n=1 Tax=Vibrio tetraodonis TaxID=2231647 RepID=UPI000E0B6553|nr:hypothetical protein [Vibrio tetraodonis]
MNISYSKHTLKLALCLVIVLVLCLYKGYKQEGRIYIRFDVGDKDNVDTSNIYADLNIDRILTSPNQLSSQLFSGSGITPSYQFYRYPDYEMSYLLEIRKLTSEQFLEVVKNINEILYNYFDRYLNLCRKNPSNDFCKKNHAKYKNQDLDIIIIKHKFYSYTMFDFLKSIISGLLIFLLIPLVFHKKTGK